MAWKEQIGGIEFGTGDQSGKRVPDLRRLLHHTLYSDVPRSDDLLMSGVQRLWSWPYVDLRQIEQLIPERCLGIEAIAATCPLQRRQRKKVFGGQRVDGPTTLL